MKPLLRGHPDKKATPLGRSLDKYINLNKLISTLDTIPPLLKGHISD